MNRWKYASPLLLDNESTLTCERNVRIYDGDIKTNFGGGELIVTTHRILWGQPGVIPRGQSCLTLDLSLIVYVEEESPSTFSFSRSRKIVLHLSEFDHDTSGHEGRVQLISSYNYVKLSFREGFSSDVSSLLSDCLQKRHWETRQQQSLTSPSRSHPHPPVKLRTGIVGIERGLQEKQKATDASINVAFQDLSRLIGMAKDMVKLTSLISTKIKEKQGDITEDETVRFKSYLLSLGIDDPVTRDLYKSDNQYYKGLAAQICEILRAPIEEMGGMMALTDVFCRVNRARGLELISPEDLWQACHNMENFPLKLYRFESGVMVLQLASLDDDSVAEATGALIQEKGSFTSEELSQQLGISVTLARERLLTAEKLGRSCRDDSIEGLRFYPNLLLLNS